MKTLYLKDGTEIQRDGIDAKDYVRAGLATYEKPEPVVPDPVDVVVSPDSSDAVANTYTGKKRGPKPKGE